MVFRGPVIAGRWWAIAMGQLAIAHRHWEIAEWHSAIAAWRVWVHDKRYLVRKISRSWQPIHHIRLTGLVLFATLVAVALFHVRSH
jgi:hypothetical protein